MADNDQIMRLLEEVQHMVKVQAEISAFRWRIVVIVAIVSFVIGAPAILSYIHHTLVRLF